MPRKEQENSSRRTALKIGAVLGILIVLFSIYVLFRRTAARFSMDFYYPVLKGIRSAEDVAAKTVLMTMSRAKLTTLADRLQRENTILRAQTAQLEHFLLENKKMRNLLGLNAPRRFHPVFAEVLLRDPVNWNEQFTIDKGSGDGIEPGNLVCTIYYPENGRAPVNAVAGRIAFVSNHSATVVTLQNRECRLPVMLPESNAGGILCGNSGSGTSIRLVNLPVHAKFGAGEIVLTSPYSKKTPPGMYIGTIQTYSDGTAAHISPNRLSAECIVRPAVDFENIHFVAVMTASGKTTMKGLPQ